MRVRRILVGAAFGVVLIPTAASAQGVGEIGGPPTMGAPFRFPPPHRKQRFQPRATSEAIVIGVGFNRSGRVEVVGQDSNFGLCIAIDHVKRQGSTTSCGPLVLPRSIAIDSETFEIERKRGRSRSEVTGFMQPTVAHVRIVASRHKGRRRTRKAVSGIVAMPSSDLLARLHQSTPFGYFVADFRGCLADAKMRAQAFDAAGLLLGSSLMPRPGKLFPNFVTCSVGSSSVFVIGTSARTASAGPGPIRSVASPGSGSRFAIAR